ncbi:MAG: hypothetical protein ABR927_14785 [Bacteroidales bacterium]|jgi:hypothetical protein
MKKLIFIFLAIIGYTGILTGQKPEKIYSIAKVYKPHEYFVQQAEIWWKEIEKDKTDENAWYNYYRANRYSLFTYKPSDGQWNGDWLKESTFLKDPAEIYGLIEKNIPNTYTYYRYKVVGNPSDTVMFNALLKAYKINPDNPEIYDSFVTFYEMKGNSAKRKEFDEKLYYANQISAGFLAYGYNVLMSMKPGGIILTFSDNDTYPLWLLQDVLNIRTDIVVLNTLLLMDPEYGEAVFKKINMPDASKIYDPSEIVHREKNIVDFIFKNKPASRSIYVGLPAWKQMSESKKTNGYVYASDQINEYEKNLYLVGLVLEYSSDNIDNIASLRNNFENNYSLDYIRNRFEYDISAELVDRMNINYLPGIFKLYEHYSQSGDLTNAKKMKDLGLIIAQKGGQGWLDKASSLLK